MKNVKKYNITDARLGAGFNDYIKICVCKINSPL